MPCGMGGRVIARGPRTHRLVEKARAETLHTPASVRHPPHVDDRVKHIVTNRYTHARVGHTHTYTHTHTHTPVLDTRCLERDTAHQEKNLREESRGGRVYGLGCRIQG